MLRTLLKDWKWVCLQSLAMSCAVAGVLLAAAEATGWWITLIIAMSVLMGTAVMRAVRVLKIAKK